MPRHRIDFLIDDELEPTVRPSLSGSGTAPVEPISRVAPVQARGAGPAPVAGAATGGSATAALGRVLPGLAVGTRYPAPAALVNTDAQPDCRRCLHFAASWDSAAPYLCRGFGFKSRGLPAWEVFQAGGHPCRLFAVRGQKLVEKPDSPRENR